MIPQLSVIVPVYNEAGTIRQILEKINSVAVDKEIVVVDDGSSDGTDRILNEIKLENLKIIHHSSNRGKGAAFLTGLANASGEFVIIQDADLEYDPEEYLKLIQTMKNDHLDIVLGARFLEGHHGLFIHRIGNKFLTGTLNFIFSSSLNDYATCYKLIRKETLESLKLCAKGFDIDVEIICKAIKRNLRIKEVSIDYHPRTYRQGKKIRWNDAIWAVLYMLRYRFCD